MIRINLLPTKAAKKKESVIQQLVVAVLVFAVYGGGIAWIHMQKGKQIEQQRVENNRLQEEINQLASIIAQVENYKKKQQDRNSKIDVIRKLHQGRSGPVKMMDEFTYTLPDRIWLASWKEKNKRVEIQGIGLNGAVIADFIDNLRASKYFSGVTLVQTQLKSQGNVQMQQFRVNMNVNYTPD